MNFDNVLSYLLNGSGIIFIILTLIEISPIKIDPWSYLASKIGNSVNKDLIHKIDSIEDKVNNLEKKSDKREADNIRTMILRFGDEVRHGIPHSKEHYDNILTAIHEYELYCTEHPDYKNNVAVATIKNIEKFYQKHLEQDNFL